LVLEIRLFPLLPLFFPLPDIRLSAIIRPAPHNRSRGDFQQIAATL